MAVDGAPHVDPKGKVLAVGEARKSLARACEELGVELLTQVPRTVEEIEAFMAEGRQ